MAMPAETVSSSTESKGGEIKIDEHGSEFVRAYAATATRGTPLVLTLDGDEATNPGTAAAATSAVYQLIVFPTSTETSAGFQWMQYKGDCDFALCDGTAAIAKDKYLDVVDGETAMTYDAAARSVQSIAVAREAYTGSADAETLVHLIGDRVNIASS